MKYKYYSIMRPIMIGTLPKEVKPDRVFNYPDGRRIVETAEGAKVYAWGEVEYSQPLSEDDCTNYELKPWRTFPDIFLVGKWRDSEIDVIRIENRLFALNEWDGFGFNNCWECRDCYNKVNDDRYTLHAVYRFEAQNVYDFDVSEDSEEYKRLTEIVSYRIEKNTL